VIAAHSRFLELAAASVDFELSRAEHNALEGHLVSCLPCRREVAALRGDARAIAALPLRPHAAEALAASRRRERRPNVFRLVVIGAMLALLAAGLVTVGSEVLRRAQTVVLPDETQLTGPVPSTFSPSWQAAAALTMPRSLHTSTLLPDGRVLVVGGDSGLGSSHSAEIYDARSGTWAIGPDLVDARHSHVAFAFFDEAIVVAGGYGLASEAIPAVESFIGDGWEGGPRLIEARADFAAVLQATRAIAYIGGYGSDGRALASVEILDLDADGVMLAAAPLATPRALHTATTLFDLRILVAGGVGDDGTPLASAELYDPETGQWQTVAPMHEARAYHTAIRLNDDRILVAGGEGASGASLDTAELYDATTDSWTVVPMLEARDRHGATMFAGSTVLIAGGERDGVSLASTEVFDPLTDTWTAGPPMQQPRSYVSLVRLKNGAVMVVGGASTGSSALAGVEILDPLARP